MEAQRRNPKGSFFQLFDWNSKSRKKLFSNKSELLDTDSSKQGKQNVAESFNYPQLLEVHENGHGLTGKKNDDFIPSSVATDDKYGTKAPGVVAKLMGLDCLPTSATPEPVANPFCDHYFSLNSCSQRYNPNPHIDFQYVNNIPNDRAPRSLADPRLQKMQSRPIERFQSEMVPPKSAKHIPTSHHHRLLSPIKNPGFRPTNDFAFIVEASSKIIDQSPQSEVKGKKLHFVSSSVPLKIRDVRERMEAVPRAFDRSEAFGRPKENVVSQCNRGQSRDKNHIRLIDTKTYYTPMKNRRKPVSLAAQAKVNVQRKEGFSSSDSRSANRKKADDVAKNSQHNQGQLTMQRNGQKRNHLSRLSSVHELKNQKQNCASTREKLPPRASVPSQQNRKLPLVNGSVRPVKATSKVMNSGAGSEKINTMAKDTGKEIKLSQTNTFHEKKQLDCENMYFEDNVEDHNRQIKCNITDDGCSSWDTGERQSSMDVVSFTFTSPIKKPYSVSESSEHLMDSGILHTNNIIYSPETPTLYSPRSNVTGGDALSFLLEQKLKELTCRAESSDHKFGNDGSASSISDIMETTPNGQCIGFELNLRKAKPSVYDVNSSSSDLMGKAYGRWQGLQEIEGQSSVNSNSDYGKELNLRYASLMSTIEPSSSDASYGSSDLNSISIAKGKNKQFHIMNNHEMTDCISNGVSQSSEVDLDFLDSASSSSVAYISGSCDSPTISLVEYQRSSNWELEYIMKVLCNSNMILDDLVLGQVNKVLNHSLFDHLENLEIGSAENTEDYFKLERKVLFDFMVERLDSRGEHILGGYCQKMLKWGTLLRKKEVLAEDLYKEISSWTSVGELMVDDLVDKDMSFGKGKWIDFETKEFEEGVEIEKAILSSLVDELVVDFLKLDQTVSILG